MKPIQISKVAIQGFRAYLQRQEFDLKSNPVSNFVVFAPNARGKSSLVDAFEFYFSPDATLARLGKREAQTNAGPSALAHIDAEAKGISPEVHLWFTGDTPKDEARTATSRTSTLPEPASEIALYAKVPYIVRGYELRAFSERQTPEERYQEVSTWLGLAPLWTIQKNLRSLRRQLKQRFDSTDKTSERLRDLARATNRAHTTWDEDAICAWLNTTYIEPLDPALKLPTLSVEHKEYGLIKERSKEEAGKIGLAGLKNIQSSAISLHNIVNESGSITDWEAAGQKYKDATAKEKTEKSKASEAAFNDVWNAANGIFSDKSVEIDKCPVCTSDIKDTPLGTREHIAHHMADKLARLKEYRDALAALSTAEVAMVQAHSNVKRDLTTFGTCTKDTEYADTTGAMKSYATDVWSWDKSKPLPTSEDAKAWIEKTRTATDAAIEKIEKKQGDHTYTKTAGVVDEIIQIKTDLSRIALEKKELGNLLEELGNQASYVDRQIVGHVQGQIDKLESRVNDLYKKIQNISSEDRVVKLVLPPEDDTNQQRLSLTFDFQNKGAVMPSGYLSDSQLHTLGLSLRLAAIELFNKEFPVIILDDVMTSYDIDHRKDLAKVLATEFAHHQLIVVTHGEMFFQILKEHFPEGGTKFVQIAVIEPDFGPKFLNHKTKDEKVEGALNAGEDAGNDIRNAEEEWLLSIARQFRLSVDIRQIDRPYEFSRSELAMSLGAFLSKNGLIPPAVTGFSNSFLVSLQRGVIENFASHFSDNPSMTGSSGDQLSRWKEFVWFRDQFRCACGKRIFIRPTGVNLPICKACNTPFKFPAPDTVVGSTP